MHHLVNASSRAIAELRLESATIITLAEHDPIDADGLRIPVVPAWRWLLE